jgi:hypothetical protein
MSKRCDRCVYFDFAGHDEPVLVDSDPEKYGRCLLNPPQLYVPPDVPANAGVYADGPLAWVRPIVLASEFCRSFEFDIEVYGDALDQFLS